MSDRPTARWSHYGVLAIGLVLTGLVVLGFELVERARERAHFEAAGQEVQEKIRNRIDTSVALLLAARGFVGSAPSLHRSLFERYVAELDIETYYPGILGIGFAARTTPADRTRFELAARAQSYADFRIWPEGEREEYFPINFLEPSHRRNRAAIGYDMFSEPVRRAAMSRARDTGLPSASAKVTLVQEIDADKQAGFLIYVPVYRQADPKDTPSAADLAGFVYSPFRAGDFFGGALDTKRPAEVNLEVFDGVPEAARLMYRTGRAEEHSRARFTSEATMDVEGRTWTLVLRSTPYFERSSNRVLSAVTALLGFVFSMLLFLVTRSEVRARHRAEASEAALDTERRRLRGMLMDAPAAIAIVARKDLRYELSNALNDSLVARGALIGTSVDEGMPKLESQGLKEQLERVFETGEPFVGKEVPVKIDAKDGGAQIMYFNGRYQPVRGPQGEIDSVMVFAVDVTDLVVSRQRMEALAEELRTAVRARDDFLSIAGHELRTPLTALTLQVQGLQRQFQRLEPNDTLAPLAARVDKVSVQVQRLERLVGELLDVSRVSLGRMTLEREPVDLGELVSEVVERFGDALARAGCVLSLSKGEPIVGHWDRLRLDQVITNLISNAIKYGPGQPIEVSVGTVGQRARIAVRDHGIGIAQTDRDRVFGRFERAVSQRNYGGLGLGLWISNQIVQAHEGHIALESSQGQGSLFTVDLPLG
jgi:signal transduction histidine kinase